MMTMTLSTPRAAADMRVRWLTLRLLVLGLATFAVGCINLPAEVEREFKCPAAGADSHFGDARSCSDDSGS